MTIFKLIKNDLMTDENEHCLYFASLESAKKRGIWLCNLAEGEEEPEWFKAAYHGHTGECWEFDREETFTRPDGTTYTRDYRYLIYPFHMED